MKKVLGNKKAIALFVGPGLILYVGLVFVCLLYTSIDVFTQLIIGYIILY